MAHRHKETKRKRIKPYIATPVYDDRFDWDYQASVAETQAMGLGRYGIVLEIGKVSNGAFIDMARNRLVRMFLDTDCTHLFFIDSDLRWEARAFYGLLCSGHPVCAGIYPKRQSPEEYPIHLATDDDENIVHKDGWFMCDKVPTGFLCIRRDVIETMVAEAPIVEGHNEPDSPYLFYTEIIDANNETVHPRGGHVKVRYKGEDFAWSVDYCRRFNALIPVWPDFTFTHGKHWTGNFAKSLGLKDAATVPTLDAATAISSKTEADMSDHVAGKTFEGVL